ncbi:MAG TPA: hypothetical protein VJQ25_12465 [Nitrospira sp.]|nr:hypothetical protein [Nitrospira sp.]
MALFRLKLAPTRLRVGSTNGTGADVKKRLKTLGVKREWVAFLGC